MKGKEASTRKEAETKLAKREADQRIRFYLRHYLPGCLPEKVAESEQETMNDIFIFLDEKREIGEDWRKYEPQL